MESTVFWCTPCKKYHGGECGVALTSSDTLTLRLGTHKTEFDGRRREYAELIAASNAVILVNGKVFHIDGWEKEGSSIRVNFKEKT
jgi:hypothetical protein